MPTTRGRSARSQTPVRWTKVRGSVEARCGRLSVRGASGLGCTGSRQARALAGGDPRGGRAIPGVLLAIVRFLREATLVLTVRRGARARERLELFAAQKPLDLLPVQHLALEQGPGEEMKLVHVVDEELARVVVGAIHEAPHFLVDHDRGLLAVIAVLGDLPSQEHELFLGPEG